MNVSGLNVGQVPVPDVTPRAHDVARGAEAVTVVVTVVLLVVLVLLVVVPREHGDRAHPSGVVRHADLRRDASMA